MTSKAVFEDLHGIMDVVLAALDVDEYDLEDSTDDAFVENRRADVWVASKQSRGYMFTHSKPSKVCIGSIGIMHPKVLSEFDIP